MNTTQYTLTATGPGGTANATTTVTVQAMGITNSPITHVIMLMMQNHSLDNLFGTYPGAHGLDATLPSYHQVDAAGNTVSPTPITTLTTADLTHDQPHYSKSWNSGKMDKFAFVEGDLAMQYYDTSLIWTCDRQNDLGDQQPVVVGSSSMLWPTTSTCPL